jgi:hypothetical protein
MSFQIRAVVLYNSTGKSRTLSFRLNSANVITGQSRTGKTALSHIIDYCLARGECLVPLGVIRDKVAWYALHLQFPDSQMFIARRTPLPGAATSPDVYLEVGRELVSPPLARLQPNITVEGLSNQLDRMTGITPNENVRTSPPLRATLDHAKFLVFQTQNEIGHAELLFHRQGEQFIPSAIRDTLPYFLGAVAEDTLQLRASLRDRRRELQRLTREQADAERIAGEGSARAEALLSEAVAAGLVAAPETRDLARVSEALRQAVVSQGDVPPPTSSEHDRLMSERVELRRQLQELQEKLAEARAFNSAGTEFAGAAALQAGRLEAIDLFTESDGRLIACPVCLSPLETPPPSATELRGALQRLRADLNGVTSHRPRIDEYIATLENSLLTGRGQLAANRLSLEAVETQDHQFQQTRDAERRRDHVRGRISLYLENVPDVANVADRAGRISSLAAEVERLERLLDDAAVRAELDSILNRLGQWMTAWATALDLEWQPAPHRLDLWLLTVVADTDPRPTRMNQMGGGENWLGCHLIAHLALHRWFAEKGRPVPRFLFLDQLTGVYYPPDSPTFGLEERAKVAHVYRWLFETAREITPGFQLIIVDHADLDEPWFQEAVVERWWGTQALVPQDWLAT